MIEVAVIATCDALGIEHPVREYAFAASLGRRWRFDFAWVKRRIALEIEGGVWVYGRHNRAKGYIADAEKYSYAAALGWRVLRLTPQQLEQGMLLKLLQIDLDAERCLERAERALEALQDCIADRASAKDVDALRAALETIRALKRGNDADL